MATDTKRPPVRVGCVRYLNTLPLIEGVDALPGVELVPAAPSHICGMLESGDVDIGLVSLIDYANSKVPFRIIPVGMIGSDGPTHTVRIFSTKPINEVSEVWTDRESHTSVALARLVLREKYGIEPELHGFDARERIPVESPVSDMDWPDTMLLIGDKVVTESPPAVRYPHQIDLGEAWKDITGLPFVYAAWMCRAEDAESPRIRTAVSLLDRQRRHNRTRMDWIVSKNAPGFGWPLDLAREYLGSLLRFDLDDRARQGAERFLRRASEAGLCGDLEGDRAVAFLEFDAAPAG